MSFGPPLPKSCSESLAVSPAVDQVSMTSRAPGTQCGEVVTTSLARSTSYRTTSTRHAEVLPAAFLICALIAKLIALDEREPRISLLARVAVYSSRKMLHM